MNYLNEVLNKPLPWKLISNQNYEFNAIFEIEDLTYSFESVLYGANLVLPSLRQTTKDEDIWELSFYLAGSTKNLNLDFESGITNTGNEFKVFATIVDITKKFIEVKKPSQFMFTAHEVSRIRLYDRFAKLIQSKFNYILEIKTQGIIKNYIFFKKA